MLEHIAALEEKGLEAARAELVVATREEQLAATAQRGGGGRGGRGTPRASPVPAAYFSGASSASSVAEDKEENELCVVCWEAPRSHLFAPCGHKHACADCADQIMASNGLCPTCRKEVLLVSKVFE